MDKGTLGAISTVLVAIATACVFWWAFSPSRKQRFDEDANLPFADEDDDNDKQQEEDEHQRQASDDEKRQN